MTSALSPVLLRRAGVSVLLAGGADLPWAVLHWGADLGDLATDDLLAAVRLSTPHVPHSALDRAVRVGLMPEPARGWTGRPGLAGHRLDGHRPTLPQLSVDTVDVLDDDPARSAICTVGQRDVLLGLQIVTTVELTPEGVLRLQHALVNVGDSPYILAALLPCLPLPGPAAELLDLTGRWCRERAPQRRLLQQGAWVRDSRHGRTGHDSSLLLAAGTPGFGFGHGEVWAVHTAWSGDHTTWAERLPTGEGVIGGGELFESGEMVLQPGATSASPQLYATWSGSGLDGITGRMHRHLRARPKHPRRPRPVVLNTWEAVYFDHDLGRLTRLADAAAGLGVERFVLDDGWFVGRRDGTRGLGDWTVDTQVWPDGLHPLVEHVRSLGMEFGLWVEPEMVNRDSDLARAHPDWVLGAHDEDPPSWRHQQVLDLANPAGYAHVRDALLTLLDEYDIGFLKWDMNRDLIDTGGAVHAQTLAVYSLLDEVRGAHPRLEIESCSSGGARVDLGILAHTDRVWASDCNDALERQHIQRWTGLLVPPELVGAHVGPPEAHTTGRVHRLAFRAATALFGHFGMEWDITDLTPEESTELAGWIELYKAERDLLHTGRVVRGDHPDPSLWVHGVVSTNGERGLFGVVAMATSPHAVPLPVRLPGLDRDRHYEVEAAGPPPAESAPLLHLTGSWTEKGAICVVGSVLTEVGLALPTMALESALVLRVRAVVDPSA